MHNFGPSVPDEETGHIFELIHRYATPSRCPLGTLLSLGLGLYMVREVALAHGGAITVTSSREQETCFEVCLPKNN